MLFKSKAQMRWMFSTHPAMAKEWAKETKAPARLPNYADPHHSHPFSFDPGATGKCLICGQAKRSHHIV